MFQYTSFVGLYAIAAIVLGLTAAYVWRRRDAPGGFYFSMLLIAGMAWALGITLEMAAVDVQLKIFFARLTYVGIVSIAPIWILFNLAYSHRSRYVSRKTGAVLWIVPVVVLALVFTNEWHHLIWTTITPVSGEPGAVLIYGHGPGVLLSIAYSYCTMLAGTLLLIRTLMRTSRQFYKQTITLVLGTLMPLIGSVVYFLWLGDDRGIDPTPLAIAATGLFFAWSMFRYQLFDLVPVAREILISSMIDGVIVIDDKDRIIDRNPAAQRLVDGDVAIGQPVASVLARWPDLASYSQKSGDGPAEVRLDRPEGQYWLDVRVSPIRDNRGLVTGRLMVMRDITKRKKAEKALDETRYNFQTLFDTVDDLLLIVDEKGMILDVNKAVVRRLGYTRKEVVGMVFLSLIPPENREFTIAGIAEVLAGTRENGPRVLLAKDGARIQVETRVAPVMWGGRRAVFGISCDISELIRQQEELQRMNVTLNVEVEERRRTEKQIQSSLREKEVLLKEIHHRVKNNMQIISSLLNLQLSGESSEEIVTAFRESQNRITTMALVHERLYQSGDLSRIDFAGYVQSLVGNLRRSYPGSCNVNTQVDVEGISVDIDRAIPCGLIINELVSNSFKYAFRGRQEGTIRVSFTGSGNVCTLTVSDDGTGMPPGMDIRNPGTLGLQLVNTLVGQISGTVELDRAAGTRFTITFNENRTLHKLPLPQGEPNATD
ncbi:histidine kinase N-terminal 7TM domain-containing protein [Methanocella sp. MCL-LM]|uniref:histidine kinase N-terminal 7TM domain-containing protein n=1 Tax=Methanocella sp. MCL-LM TaxID=3412035 RepID=UPI003C73193E